MEREWQWNGRIIIKTKDSISLERGTRGIGKKRKETQKDERLWIDKETNERYLPDRALAS